MYAAVCLYCEWRVYRAPRMGHYELARLQDHLVDCHPETVVGKLGFYAPSPGLILEHFRVEARPT